MQQFSTTFFPGRCYNVLQHFKNSNLSADPARAGGGAVAGVLWILLRQRQQGRNLERIHTSRRKRDMRVEGKGSSGPIVFS